MTEDFVPTASDLAAHGVDRQFQDDVNLLGEWAADLFVRLRNTAQGNKIRERAPVLALLSNALLTVTAALELWRRGFLLQVGILLRTAIETVATAAVITSDSVAGERHRRGEYDSSKALSDLKKVWPDIGGSLAKATGVLSNEFVHVGESYRTWLVISPGLTDRHIEDLRAMLLPIKAAFHLIDLLSEMVCWGNVDRPRYWRHTGPQRYERALTDEGREWMKKAFKEDLSKVSER